MSVLFRVRGAILLLSLLAAHEVHADEPALSPEVQLCLMHLRDGERAKLQSAVGPLSEIPLYRLQLELDPKERTVHGRVQVIQAATTHPLTAMNLRVTPNAQGPRVRLANATLNGQPAVMDHPEPTLYRVKFDPAVPPGAAAVVEVLIDATVPELPEGSATLMGAMSQTTGLRDYGAFSASPDGMLLTGILPQIPPEDASGQPWDGPSGMGDLGTSAPAHVLMSITAPVGYQVLTTGVALGEVPQKGGTVRFSFAASGVRDVPMAVMRGYQKKTATIDGIEVESWFLPQDATAGARVLEYAKGSVEEMQKRLGPIPWKVLRVIEAPLTGGAGGMEFSGATVINANLYRASTNPAQALGLPPGFEQLLGMGGGKGAPDLGRMLEDTLEFTIAHEVAHQYFAELVGSDPVNEPVVDETLAQYTALLYLEWKHGKTAFENARRQQLVGTYQMYRMSGGADGVAARPTGSFSDSTEYAALVYAKAPLLHHALRKELGDATFLKGLRAYVDAYRYKWSCETCFTDTLAKLRPGESRTLAHLREHWWDQAHGDEDLGKPSLNGLMQGMGMPAMDPKTEKMMQEILEQLSGG